MKKILMAAVALTALTATPAMAADPTGANYDVQGTVAATCGFGANSTLTGTIDFGELTAGANGTVSKSTATGSYSSNVYCNNGGGIISIIGSGASGAYTIAKGSGVGAPTLSYSPKVTLGGQAISNGGSLNGGGALVVSAENITSGSAVAPSGLYTGTLTVTVSPS